MDVHHSCWFQQGSSEAVFISKLTPADDVGSEMCFLPATGGHCAPSHTGTAGLLPIFPCTAQASFRAHKSIGDVRYSGISAAFCCLFDPGALCVKCRSSPDPRAAPFPPSGTVSTKLHPQQPHLSFCRGSAPLGWSLLVKGITSVPSLP